MKRLTKFVTALALLLSAATGAWAEKTPQVLWCEGNQTLYFINAETVYAASDTYSSQTVTAAWSGTDVTNSGTSPGWSTYNANVQSVVFDESFNAVRPTTCRSWFYQFANLTGITGLGYLNTSEVTEMGYMFQGCGKLTSLALAGAPVLPTDEIDVEKEYELIALG